MSPTPAPLRLYAAASGLLEPLAPALLRARARHGKEDAARLHERLGHATIPRPAGDLVWLHAVSVGESLSVLPLAQALGARRPDISVLVTSGTVTSAQVLAERLPPGAIHQFAPVDGPAATRRFLDHWRPSLGVLVESELWPNLILGAAARGVRLALVSARMTEASARGWGRTASAARRVLSAFDLILPQDADTEARLKRLGAEVGPRLNLKQIAAPLPFDPAALAHLRARLDGRRVVLAVSTHPGEEAIIGRAFARVSASRPDLSLIIVPRHPARGEAVVAELAGAGLEASRRAAGAQPGAGVYVADTLGELGLFLGIADLVVMGGSFVDGIGGHNPLEPARLARAMITGPYAFNARELYDELFAWAGAVEATDEAALARHMAGFADNPQVARRTGEAALACAERQGQALDRALALLEPLLP
ncbi:MAG: 3-deoxy-D-manno-octulosonic acid transferase [Phenylobacterium sp.]|uniref:3-deoxy-D-manno-octulosonic acid transferase n=1 Tax=Phenylobacterium sp. TaxID=1871053 RepID=UPI002736CD83|nr:3-deoxy-D-manno-octulosonic acid transferase [Phenylobacterium sp.]MDP3173791.1 3-deoxy-D-manno-octulosonic acid transferase [Phenylobacterium sp.]